MYDHNQGGGYLVGMLVHDLDFVCSLLGEPESVCAEVRTSEPVRHLPDGQTIEVTADDTAALLLRMESGVVAVLSVSVIGAHADHYRLELFGSEGTIIGDGTLRSTDYRIGAASDDALTTLPIFDRERAHPENLPHGLAGHASRAMALMLEDWLPAFDGTPGAAPTFDDGCAQPRRHRRRPPVQRSGGGWVAVRI